jgi:hypothetical protein
VQRIAEWQRQGGKIIADEFLCPALHPDLTLKSFKRTKKAAEDKTRILGLAKILGPCLDSLGLKRALACDQPEILLQTRRQGDALYLFAVNDRREFGTYVGQHGLVMENGLPSSGTVRLPGLTKMHAYDLVAGVELPLADEGRIPLSLGPCDGTLLLVLTRAIGGVSLTLPESAKPGDSVNLAISLTDSAGAPLNAVIPAQVEIRDANGRLAERSGHYAIKNGSLRLTLDLAPNEDPGAWHVTLRELASRRSASGSVQVIP